MPITPRATRLIRVPDLPTFRHTLAELACAGAPLDARHRLVVVPTRAAAAYLVRSIEGLRLDGGNAVVLPDLITRGELTTRLAERLPGAHHSLLTDAEREVLAGVACREAIAAGAEPPFRLRPGLVAEILRFYDALQRNLKDVNTFERLCLGALEPGAAHDRGAERLVRQTQFLAAAFRHLERLVAADGRFDEHGIRRRLLAEAPLEPWRHVVLAVGDQASDRHGLLPADWDLLSRLPGLEQLDVVTTDATVAGPFHERIHQLLPGIDEVRVEAVEAPDSRVLLVPPGSSAIHVARDREEEVGGFARWVRQQASAGGAAGTLDSMALVVYRPLPYVYLARNVLRAAGIPLQMFDALPLASEPHAAALDLVLAFVAGNFGRAGSIALLRSPHFRFGPADMPLTLREVAALDKALSESGYLGDVAALDRLVASWRDSDSDRGPVRALRAAMALLDAAARLSPLREPAPCAEHIGRLLAFCSDYERLPDGDGSHRARQLRGRAAVLDVLVSLRDAYGRFDAAPVEFDTVAAVVRRWIDGHTFAPRTGDTGVHLVDADSARFGAFDCVQLAGLVDGEWPDAPRRNIFYPPSLLRDLGWPAETERLDGVRAAFNDLTTLPASQLRVSTFSLEDDAVVAMSPLVDALPAGIDVQEPVSPSSRIFDFEALALAPVVTAHLEPMAAAAAARRMQAGLRAATGATTGHEAIAFSLSALERYQDCPFKYFAVEVLKLEEPPEDEPLLSPRARGRFVHEVFQRFFEAWDARGCETITVERVDEARALFEQVAAPLLARFSDAEALLERARLFGSAVSIGIVDVVLGLEASRQVPVQERWLEYRLEGTFALGGEDGTRIPLKGVADRIDLLEGNRLRVIDYKSGYPPLPKRALQAPIYALCAQERLADRDGRPWEIDEASYVAFAGKRSLVPIVKPGTSAAQVLASARARVIEIAASIGSGAFPAQPYELRLCGYCAYPSVCRKDYVGDD
jgi:RecB family exonuclease